MTELRLGVPVVAVLFLGAFASGANADAGNPFKISDNAFRERIRTIALVPVRVPGTVPSSQLVENDLEKHLRDRLRAAGFEVVPSREYARIWRTMSERLGGTYEAKSSDHIADRWQVARRHTLRALAAEFGSDAVARLSFHHGPMSVYRDSDGWGPFAAAGRRLEWQGKRVPAYRPPQKVFGYFLDFAIRDLSDARIFDISVPFQWTEIRMDSGREVIPPEALFADSEQIAVRIARA